MSVRVLSAPFKPTFHRGRYPQQWAELRQHCVLVLPMWERGGNRVYSPTHASGRASVVNADWADLATGPVLRFAATGYIDTRFQRFGSVGLHAVPGETWTAVVRSRIPLNTDGTLMAKASGTLANRTFQIEYARINNAQSTPRIRLKGSVTHTNWGLDDNTLHTIWVTWDGAVARAYYDDARGATVIAVGTAAEEAQNILLGARTLSAPANEITGDIDFAAILDMPLTPAEIIEWNGDLYAPWRTGYRQTRVVPRPIPATVAVPTDIVDRDINIELWSDTAGNGGLRRAVLSQVFDLEERQAITNEHTITFSIPITHPAVRLIDTGAQSEFRINQVIRFVRGDSQRTEHRIDEVTRSIHQGDRRLKITAVAIAEDLTTHGVVSKTYPNGHSTSTFTSMGLTMAEHIQTYILPVLRGAGLHNWVIGVMSHDRPIDVSYANESPQSALRLIAEEGGDLELHVTVVNDEYRINIVRQIGSGLAPVHVHTDSNLLDLDYTERQGDQANRVYAFGSTNEDGIQATIGQAEWEILYTIEHSEGMDLILADPAGGDGPIKFDGQFLPIEGQYVPDEDPSAPHEPHEERYHVVLTTGGLDWKAPIIDTFATAGFHPPSNVYAEAQTVRVLSDVIPPLPVSGAGRRRVKIVADPTKRENLYVDYPDSIYDYGVRTGVLDRSDIPPTNNLIPNPLGRRWSTASKLPHLWVEGGDANVPLIVTRETSSRYWEHGGKAVKAIIDPSKSIGSPLAIIPPDAQGFISFFARVIVLSGKCRVGLMLRRWETDLNEVATPYLPYRSGQSYLYFYPDSYGQLTNEPEDEQIADIESSKLNDTEDLGEEAVWDLSKLPLYGGFAQVYVRNAREATTPCTVIIGGFQVTLSSRQQPLLEGFGGNKLHHAAQQRVGIYGKPAKTVSLNLIDLAAAEGKQFPYKHLRIGSAVIITEREADVHTRARIVSINRDWRQRLMPSIEVSHLRPTLTSMLHAHDRTPRQLPSITPKGTRGQNYSS